MAFPRRIDAVVFDMDGLLVDTETLYALGVRSAGHAFGVDVTPDIYRRMVGHSTPECHAIMVEHFGAAFPLEAYWARMEAECEALVVERLALKTGVVELLDHLDEFSLPRGIATSNRHYAVDLFLNQLGVRDRFHTVVAENDAGAKKPHPAPFLMVANRLGVDPAHCLALEDSHAGVRAAHAAGMMTVMVPDLLDPTEEMHEKCVHIADSLHRVLDLVRLTR